MNYQLIALCTLGLTLSACGGNNTAEPKPDTTPQPMIAGGYSNAPTTDAEVQAAAQFAAKTLGSELVNVLKVERQVVAGMNYRMHLALKNGAEYEVVVYRDLQQQMSLSSSKVIKAATN